MNFSKITILAYRPSYNDYCRNCLMTSTDSDLEIYHAVDFNDAVKVYAQYLYMNKVREREFAPWELTLFLDGKDDDFYDENDPEPRYTVEKDHKNQESEVSVNATYGEHLLSIRDAALILVDERLAEKVKSEKEKAARKEKAELLEQKKKDLEELRRLQGLYPGA